MDQLERVRAGTRPRFRRQVADKWLLHAVSQALIEEIKNFAADILANAKRLTADESSGSAVAIADVSDALGRISCG